MSSPTASPKYYTPSYGLPQYERPSADTRFQDKNSWRAPGVGAGRLQWEPLHGRSTPYPWEHDRPPEAWERYSRTVQEGPLPVRPEPVAPPKPADPLPPVDLDRPATPDAEPFPSRVQMEQTERHRPRPPRPDGPARVRPGGPRGSQQLRGARPVGTDEVRPPQAQLQTFPPPTGQPVVPGRHQPLRPRPQQRTEPINARKGGLPWVSLLLILLVFIEPVATLIPLLAGMLLIAGAKSYRNPAARVGWGVFVLVLTIAAFVVRIIMSL